MKGFELEWLLHSCLGNGFGGGNKSCENKLEDDCNDCDILGQKWAWKLELGWGRVEFWSWSKERKDGRAIRVMESMVLLPLLQGQGDDWEDDQNINRSGRLQVRREHSRQRRKQNPFCFGQIRLEAQEWHLLAVNTTHVIFSREEIYQKELPYLSLMNLVNWGQERWCFVRHFATLGRRWGLFESGIFFLSTYEKKLCFSQWIRPHSCFIPRRSKTPTSLTVLLLLSTVSTVF